MKYTSYLQVHRLVLILSVLFSTVGCDQVTKMVAREKLSMPMNMLGGVVRLQHAENPGAFMSFGDQLPPTVRFLIFTVAVAIALSVVLIVLWRKKQWDLWTTVAVTFLVAGGFGNLIDRAAKGTVTDFLNLGFGWFRTGIFNVADMAIVLGGLILLFHSFRPQKKSEDLG